MFNWSVLKYYYVLMTCLRYRSWNRFNSHYYLHLLRKLMSSHWILRMPAQFSSNIVDKIGRLFLYKNKFYSDNRNYPQSRINSKCWNDNFLSLTICTCSHEREFYFRCELSKFIRNITNRKIHIQMRTVSLIQVTENITCTIAYSIPKGLKFTYRWLCPCKLAGRWYSVMLHIRHK